MGSPSCSEIPGTAYRSLSPPPSTAVSTSLPAMVVPYLCILLVGLSGMVIAIHPASSNGLRTWFLNLVRSFLPTTAMSSVMGCAANDLRRISTWCRPGPDLVPRKSRPNPCPAFASRPRSPGNHPKIRIRTRSHRAPIESSVQASRSSCKRQSLGQSHVPMSRSHPPRRKRSRCPGCRAGTGAGRAASPRSNPRVARRIWFVLPLRW